MGIVFLQGASSSGGLSLPTGTSASAVGLTLRVKQITPTDDVEVALDVSDADIIQLDLTNAAIDKYLTLAGLSGGVDGKFIYIHNLGSPTKDKDLVVFYDNTNAAVGNRILGPRDAIAENSTAVHGTIMIINQGACAPLYYSSTIGGWVIFANSESFSLSDNASWSHPSSSSPSYGGGGV